MNYYEHHIGDYAAATAHLSLLEDAVYSRLLRRYYLQEEPLPVEERQVARLVGARSPEEVEAVQVVLAEFFVLEADGWHNKRADEEIARYQDKQAKARASAEARWSKPAKRPDCERNANAMRAHSEGNALQTPDTKHQTEQEQKQARKRATSPARPPDVDESTWEDWLTLRKAKRAPVTETVVKQARAEADKAGLPLTRFLEIWCARGSQGLQADWLKPNELAQARAGPGVAQAVGKQMQGVMSLEAMKRERLARSGNPGGAATAGLLVAGPDSGG